MESVLQIIFIVLDRETNDVLDWVVLGKTKLLSICFMYVASAVDLDTDWRT